MAMTTDPATAVGGWGKAPEPTVEELIRARGARPVTSVADLMVPGVFDSDDEVDEFVTTVRTWRDAELG
jgi:hypothetical protein